MVVDLKANEMVKMAGDVQHLSENIEVKGKLILTNQRIYFQTSSADTADFNLEIIPRDIQELLYFKSGFFSSNGLTVRTKNGKELRFIVKKRDAWCKMINRMY
ncbi:MAG: hypothetical protein U9R60_04375 [Bacteroidota bacterium]|nr:hypothetical protein [Bacteroidota bacterium]